MLPRTEPAHASFRRPRPPIPFPDTAQLELERQARLKRQRDLEEAHTQGFIDGEAFARKAAAHDAAYWTLAGTILGGFAVWLFATAGMITLHGGALL